MAKRDMIDGTMAGNISRRGKVSFLIDAVQQRERRNARNSDVEERRRACLQNATFQGSKAKVTLAPINLDPLE